MALKPDLLIYFKKQISLVEQRVGKLNIQLIENTEDFSCWYDVTDKQLALSSLLVKSKLQGLIIILHELGHAYTYSQKNTEATNEFKANLWALEYIKKYLSDKPKILKLYIQYLVFCLNYEKGSHKVSAIKIFNTLETHIQLFSYDAVNDISEYAIQLPRKYDKFNFGYITANSVNKWFYRN